MKLPISCLFISVFFCSCAAGYKTINPSKVVYSNGDSATDFFYRYNVLKEAGNKKFSKKEDKEHIRIVAIKIVNNTGHTLKYGSNYKLFSGNKELEVLKLKK